MLTLKERYLRSPYEPPQKSQITAVKRFSHTHNLTSIPSRSAGCRPGPAEKLDSLGADLQGSNMHQVPTNGPTEDSVTYSLNKHTLSSL